MKCQFIFAIRVWVEWVQNFIKFSMSFFAQTCNPDLCNCPSVSHSWAYIKSALRIHCALCFSAKLFPRNKESLCYQKWKLFSCVCTELKIPRLLFSFFFPRYTAATKATNHWGCDKSCHGLWPSLRGERERRESKSAWEREKKERERMWERKREKMEGERRTTPK